MPSSTPLCFHRGFTGVVVVFNLLSSADYYIINRTSEFRTSWMNDSMLSCDRLNWLSLTILAGSSLVTTDWVWVWVELIDQFFQFVNGVLPLTVTVDCRCQVVASQSVVASSWTFRSASTARRCRRFRLRVASSTAPRLQDVWVSIGQIIQKNKDNRNSD